MALHKFIPYLAARFAKPASVMIIAAMTSMPLRIAAQTTPAPSLSELLATASELTRQADFAGAIPVLKRAIQLAPEDVDANFMLGVAFFQTGYPAQAIQPLRTALTADAEREAAAAYLGNAELELKDFPSAAETFLRAVADFHGSEQSLVWWTDFALERYRNLEFSLRATSRGRAQMMVAASEASGLDLRTKASLLKQAVVLDESVAGAWGSLGMVQLGLGLLTDAESSLANALQTQPEAMSTLQLESMIEAARGNWTRAEALLSEVRGRSADGFQRLLTAWPKDLAPPPGAKGDLAECLRSHPASCSPAISVPASAGSNSDRIDFAEQRWEDLTAMSPPPSDHPEQWFWRGMAFANLGNCQRAIPALERGLVAGAEVAAARLCECYKTEAVRAADRLMAEGKSASVHKIRGDIQLSIHLDPAKAEAEYKTALALKPDDPETLEKLADAYFSHGEMKQSEQTAEKALELAPQRTQILQLLVRIAMKDRDYPKAIALLQRMLRQEPANQWAQVQQATAYAQTGQAAEAVQKLQAALDAGYPDANGSLHALLSVQLQKLGRKEEAQAANRAAVKLSDSFQEQTKQDLENQQ